MCIKQTPSAASAAAAPTEKRPVFPDGDATLPCNAWLKDFDLKAFTADIKVRRNSP